MRVRLAAVGLVVLSVLAAGAVGAAMHPGAMHHAMGISVVIDGERQEYAAPPMMMNGRVMVPMRAIFESLGASVTWHPSERAVSAAREGHMVRLTVGKREGMINGAGVMLGAAPRMYRNHVYVPLRFVSEAMGAKVNWEADTRQVMIERGDPPMAMGMMGGPGHMQGPGMMRHGEAPATPTKQADGPSDSGQKVYTDQGCNACHKINGNGGDIGPDLTHVGAKRGKQWLEKVITDPKSLYPNSEMPAYKLSQKELDALVDYLAGLK
jgi:mono/diheme cytochrome c family protein